MIVPNTFIESENQNKLFDCMISRFPNTTFTRIQRRHFSETIGKDLIKLYCSKDSDSELLLFRDKLVSLNGNNNNDIGISIFVFNNASDVFIFLQRFYALSAAGALIKYVEFKKNVRLASRSLKVEYQGTEDIMIIGK